MIFFRNLKRKNHLIEKSLSDLSNQFRIFLNVKKYNFL